MKSCVVTANYACDPNKVWLYLTKPTLNGWRRDVSSYEESDDGLKAAEKNTDPNRLYPQGKAPVPELQLPEGQDQRHLYGAAAGRR